MECKEKQRLTEEYFEAFIRQQAITLRLNALRTEGDTQLISVAEQQSDIAIEECYEAWHALNEHQCSPQCEVAG